MEGDVTCFFHNSRGQLDISLVHSDFEEKIKLMYCVYRLREAAKKVIF